VINLVPDKRRVYAEIYRVLKPGGRFSISDVATYGAVPPEVRGDIDKWTGCIAGAMDRDEYLQIIQTAGFADVKIDRSVEYDYLKGEHHGVMSITVEGRKE
jgi:SAM-dependent methyltransferase